MWRFLPVGRCAGLLAAAQVKDSVFSATWQPLWAYKRRLFQACILNLSEAAGTAPTAESQHGNAVGNASVAEEEALAARKLAEEEANRAVLKEIANARIVRSVETTVLEQNVVESSECNLPSAAQRKVEKSAAGMLDEENDEDEEDDEELSSMELTDEALEDDEQFDTESDEEMNLSAAEALAEEFSARQLSDDELASKDEITSSAKKKKSYLHKLTIQEVEAVLEKLRPINLKILNVQERCEWADHMVFVTGRSTRHVRGMADSIVEAVKKKSTLDKHSMFPIVEGRHSEEWMVVDCANIIIHVFSEEARARYNLEAKWGGTEEVEEVADDDDEEEGEAEGEEEEEDEDDEEHEGAETLETR